MPVIKSGNLTKQGGASSSNLLLKSISAMSFKKRYFEFDGEKMVYYKSETERERLGDFDLKGGFIVTEASEKSKQENSFEIVTQGNSYLLSAESKKEMKEWFDVLTQYARKGSATDDKSDEEDGSHLNVDMQLILQNCTLKGRLSKLGSKVSKFKQWRKRWFVLHPTNKLYYIKNLEDPRPLGVIDLATCTDIKNADEELNSQHTFVINVPGRSYYCQGENAQEVNMWMSAIGTILQTLVEKQMQLFMRTASSNSATTSTSNPSLSSSSENLGNRSNDNLNKLDSLTLSPESSRMSLDFSSDDMKKAEAVLNEYLQILDKFDVDLDDESDADTIGGDYDDGEIVPEPTAPSGQTAAPSLASQPVDDSTKNLINTLFRLNSTASKVMKHFSKLVGSSYLVRVLGPIISDICSLDDAMEVDPSRKAANEDTEINKKKLTTACQKILSAILSSQKQIPSEMIMMCRHLYFEVEKKYPGNGSRQVGGYLFLRFFCPAIVQPNAHGVIPPDFTITDNSKRCLLLITKVLQNLSNGILFGAKELYMGGPLNDFISNNIPVLEKFFASFADMDWSGPSPLPPTSASELASATGIFVTNLRFAIQFDTELATKLGSRQFGQLNELLADDVEPDHLARLISADCAFAAAVCSTMKPTQIDPLAEALVIMYCKGNQVVKMLQWIITDEVMGTGLASKKFDVPNTEGGEVRPVKVLKSGYLTKLGGNFKTWRKRWFVLTEDSLSYYKVKDDTIPIQAIEMRVCSSIKNVDDALDTGGFGFAISTPGRVYKFAAATEQERIQWIEAIKPFVEKGLLANLMKASRQHQNPGSEKKGSVASTPSEVVDTAKYQPRTRASVDRAMASLTKAGWLFKKGGTFKSWQKRWFILKNGYLVYYKDEAKGELLGLIDFEECTKVEPVEAKLNTPRCFEVATPSKNFFLVAENDMLFQSWTEILRQVLFYFKPALAYLVSATPSSPEIRNKKVLMEGWLTKEGGQNKSWKNRWFVLRDRSLTYFVNSAESTTESLAKGVIDLNDANIQLIEDHKFSFCFAVSTSNRVYFLLAKDRADLDKWFAAIQGQTTNRRSSMLEDAPARSTEGLAKYQNAVLDKWNAIAHQKPTVKVGAAELSHGATCGYLLKASKPLTDKSISVKNWRSRYFVLKNHCLYYFKGTMDDEALGMIELANIEIDKIADNPEACTLLAAMKGQKSWQRANGDESNYANAVANKIGFVLKGRTKKFFILAESDQLARTWITAIKNATKAWEALLEKAGVSEDQRKDANTTKFVQRFLRSDARATSRDVVDITKDSSFTNELFKALSSRASKPLSAYQEDSSDDSSGDEGA